MKALKNILLVTILVFGITINTSYANDVLGIEVINDKTLNFVTDEYVELSEGTINSELKVLKDVAVDISTKDFEDLSKVIIVLQDEIKASSKYNLLSVAGVDAGIDFETNENLDGDEIENNANNPDEQGISKVIIRDTTTLELIFNQPVEGDEFDFKIFMEVGVDGVLTEDANTITVNLLDSIDANTDYVLMVVSFYDSLENEVVFNGGIYDFTSPSDIAIQEEVMDEDPLLTEEDQIMENPMMEDSMNEEPMIEEMDTEEPMGEDNVDDIALNAAETPDTGAETWVLILGTLLINTTIFIRRKLTRA